MGLIYNRSTKKNINKIKEGDSCSLQSTPILHPPTESRKANRQTLSSANERFLQSISRDINAKLL